MVTVKINGEDKFFEEGIQYQLIAEQYQRDYDSQIALVVVNGKIQELMKRLNKDCELEFVTYADVIGHKTYVRSAVMLMMKAIKDVAGIEAAVNVKVETGAPDKVRKRIVEDFDASYFPVDRKSVV